MVSSDRRQNNTTGGQRGRAHTLAPIGRRQRIPGSPAAFLESWRGHPAPCLSAGTRNLGKAVEIRIRDNGTGIATEVREKIFNPFFTTKPTGEGTGLGLSMAHDIIVKQHGGRIDVDTEPGAFTEFIITLPRDNGAAVGRELE